MHLSEILDPSCVVLDVGVGSKHDVLTRLAAPITAQRPDLDSASMLAELEQRERDSSTAIADGIAIPHARPPGKGAVSASLGRSLAGVDFDSMDGQPTTLLLMLVSPAEAPELHVQWLAHVARVLGDRPTREQLLAATSPNEVLDAIRECEDRLGDESDQ